MTLSLPKKMHKRDSDTEPEVKNRFRWESSMTEQGKNLDSSQNLAVANEQHKTSRVFKTNQAFSDPSSGKSTPPRSRRKRLPGTSRKGEKMGGLTDVEEVYENANHFWEHTMFAWSFFFRTTWISLKVGF